MDSFEEVFAALHIAVFEEHLLMLGMHLIRLYDCMKRHSTVCSQKGLKGCWDVLDVADRQAAQRGGIKWSKTYLLTSSLMEFIYLWTRLTQKAHYLSKDSLPWKVQGFSRLYSPIFPSNVKNAAVQEEIKFSGLQKFLFNYDRKNLFFSHNKNSQPFPDLRAPEPQLHRFYSLVYYSVHIIIPFTC